MKKLLPDLPDVLMTVGAGVLSYGAWLVYEPSGYLVAGLLLLAAGVMIAKAAK